MQGIKMIDKLIKALKEDKKPGSYYHGWVCNITMSIKDEFSRNPKKYYNKQDIHEICNKGAENFLDILTRN